jgi:hypothetical protein
MLDFPRLTALCLSYANVYCLMLHASRLMFNSLRAQNNGHLLRNYISNMLARPLDSVEKIGSACANSALKPNQAYGHSPRNIVQWKTIKLGAPNQKPMDFIFILKAQATQIENNQLCNCMQAARNKILSVQLQSTTFKVRSKPKHCFVIPVPQSQQIC